MIGVHVGTIRRWTQDGRLEEIRTAGGHRRIPRAAAERLLRERGTAAATVEAPDLSLAESTWGRHALVHTQYELQVHHADSWMQRFDESARARSREMGQRLMGLLLQHVAGSPDEAALWAEVRDLARTYAFQMQQQQLSLTEALKATLFFRDVLTESTVYYPHLHTSDGGPQVALMRKVSQFMNEIQLAITEVYEQRPSSHT